MNKGPKQPPRPITPQFNDAARGVPRQPPGTGSAGSNAATAETLKNLQKPQDAPAHNLNPPGMSNRSPARAQEIARLANQMNNNAKNNHNGSSKSR